MIIKELQVRYNNLTCIIITILWLLVGACSEPSTSIVTSPSSVDYSLHIDRKELVLNPNQGLLLHKGIPFTGTAVFTMAEGTIVGKYEYFEGKKHGICRKWFLNGHLSYEAQYELGKQHGTSRTWWQNDTLRSESHFKNGVVHGIQRQWYKSGNIFKEFNIIDGKESGIQRAWRENGKIYNNYEAKNGRIFGLKRSTLCFELEEEKITLNEQQVDSINTL